MRIPKKLCKNCDRWFEPYPPQQDIQQFCFRKRCQRERHRQGCQAFRREDPHCDEKRRPKIRDWARKEGYWPDWRRDHPAYREREKVRMRKKRQQAKRVAKRDAWKQFSLEELQRIQAQTPETVAKRDACDRRVDDLLVWLIQKETSQNETYAPASTV